MVYDTRMQHPGLIILTLAQDSGTADATTQAASSINTLIDTLPGVGVVVGAVSLLVGVVLWLIGRKIARPACTVGGLVVGGVIGLFGGMEFFGATTAIVLGIGVAVVVGILAYVLFRVWMGISLALMFALLTPVAGLAYRGEAEPVAPTSHNDLMLDQNALAPGSGPSDWFSSEDDAGGDNATEGDGEGQAATFQVGDRLRGLYEQQQREVRAWWNSLGAAGRALVAGCSAGGALVGIILGLLLPYLAAMIQTSVVGGALMLLGAWPQLPWLAPDLAEMFPPTIRLMVLALGLITLLGVSLQWMLFGRKSDD